MFWLIEKIEKYFLVFQNYIFHVFGHLELSIEYVLNYGTIFEKLIMNLRTARSTDDSVLVGP